MLMGSKVINAIFKTVFQRHYSPPLRTGYFFLNVVYNVILRCFVARSFLIYLAINTDTDCLSFSF